MKLPPLLDERTPAMWVLWSAGGAILLGAITVGFGALFGALGGRSRERRDPAPPAAG